jgi:hypothetical protein
VIFLRFLNYGVAIWLILHGLLAPGVVREAVGRSRQQGLRQARALRAEQVVSPRNRILVSLLRGPLIEYQVVEQIHIIPVHVTKFCPYETTPHVSDRHRAANFRVFMVI